MNTKYALYNHNKTLHSSGYSTRREAIKNIPEGEVLFIESYNPKWGAPQKTTLLNSLSAYETKDIQLELSNRVGTDIIEVAPHEEKTLTVTGPCIIMIVTD